MARILTEHLESGWFSEQRVLTYIANTFIIRDSSTAGAPSGDGSRRWINLNNAVGETYVRLQMFGFYTEVYGEIFYRFPIQPLVGSDQIIRFFNDAQPMMTLRVTPANHFAPVVGGALNIPKPEGSLDLTWGVWHCLEFYYKIHASSGEFTCKVDGTEACSFVGDTTFAGKTSFNNVDMFAQLMNSCDLDGLVINDTTTSDDNTWPAIIYCASRDPNADMVAHNDWSVTIGGSKFPKVSEYPDNVNSYIYSVTNGQKQGFTYPAFNVPANSVPISVITEDTCRKISEGQIKQGQRLAGVEDQTAAKDLGVDLKVMQNRQIRDPNGAVWTLANANASESFVEAII
jgi:hypothetical protein